MTQIDKISGYYEIGLKPSDCNEECELMLEIIEDIHIELSDDDLLSLGINRLSLLKTQWLIALANEIGFNANKFTANNTWNNMVNFNVAEKENFVAFLLSDKTILCNVLWNDPEGETDSKLKQFFQFLKKCLNQCSEQFNLFYQNVKWFPMVYEYVDDDNYEWVLDGVVANLSTEATFNFGILFDKLFKF